MSLRDPSSFETRLDVAAVSPRPSSAPQLGPWSSDIVWGRLCPREVKDKRSWACQEKYNELFKEWRNLSLDTSIEWTDQLEEKLEGVGDVDDFFKWMKEQLQPDHPKKERPNFDCLKPGFFVEFLRQANWKDYDKASQLITGRLWYGKVNQWAEIILGWVHPAKGWAEEGLLALRLNAHDLSPKETDYGLCDDLRIKTLLPHIFVGMRYLPDSEQASPVDKCLLLLGDLFILHSRKITPTNGRCNTTNFERTKYLLALELNSRDKEFILLSNPGNVDASDKNLPIGRLEVLEQSWIFDHVLVIDGGWGDVLFRQDRSRTEGFDYVMDLTHSVLDLKHEKLSSKEPELVEVGLSESEISDRFVAMFPPR